MREWNIEEVWAMKPRYSAYDPETIQILKSVLDTAWASLLPNKQDKTTKSRLSQPPAQSSRKRRA